MESITFTAIVILIIIINVIVAAYLQDKLPVKDEAAEIKEESNELHP